MLTCFAGSSWFHKSVLSYEHVVGNISLSVLYLLLTMLGLLRLRSFQDHIHVYQEICR
jgi:hypothetical protein